MRTLLVCHADAPLDRDGLARWLASFSDLAGVVVVHETGGAKRRRARRELKRSGWLGFLDVLAFRLWYALVHARADARWEARELDRLRARYPEPAPEPPILEVETPNSAATEAFVRARRPHLMIARCKFILRPGVFTIPTHGTFVMHPGICPEYRNAHGCFWALAEGDADKVGMTLLRIDEGIDTGPVYGYYSYDYRAARESHVVIQARTVLENLDAVAAKLQEIARGEAEPLDTIGRPSGVWGQPRLSAWLRLRRAARRRRERSGRGR
ncbi:MAG TPA: formyl transferase [Alphaproteobacteria bacterium]|nr:formyl transferase [Alphaproteobacteria bacterium]